MTSTAAYTSQFSFKQCLSSERWWLVNRGSAESTCTGCPRQFDSPGNNHFKRGTNQAIIGRHRINRKRYMTDARTESEMGRTENVVTVLPGGDDRY